MAEEIASISQKPLDPPLLTQQEKGVRPSCAIPYQLYVDGALSRDGQNFNMLFRADKKVFGKRSTGAPFNVYARGARHSTEDKKIAGSNEATIRSSSYTVAAGDTLQETWPLDSFIDSKYNLAVYGPNGFFREFTGDQNDPALSIVCEYEALATKHGNITLQLSNLK